MTGYFCEMKPDASFALKLPVPNMRAAGRVEEKAREGVRKLFDSYVVLVSHCATRSCAGSRDVTVTSQKQLRYAWPMRATL